MSLSPAQVAHQHKIQATKRILEDPEGKTIREDRIQEWALLEIAEMLQAIHFQLVQIAVNTQRIGVKKS
jgi:hypothetical protein